MVYPSITGFLVTLDALSPCSKSVCTHTCFKFFYEDPIKLIQDGRNRDTYKLLDSVKYTWVLATLLDVDLGVG